GGESDLAKPLLATERAGVPKVAVASYSPRRERQTVRGPAGEERSGVSTAVGQHEHAAHVGEQKRPVRSAAAEAADDVAAGEALLGKGPDRPERAFGKIVPGPGVGRGQVAIGRFLVEGVRIGEERRGLEDDDPDLRLAVVPDRGEVGFLDVAPFNEAYTLPLHGALPI